MQKIPTVFVRDPANRARVTPDVTPGCEWVIAGEGVATRKYDGSACLIQDGRLYKRREVKPGKRAPLHFKVVETDPETGKQVGWVPVGDGPDDQHHREAWVRGEGNSSLAPGTYELVGPKVQGGREGFIVHALIPHDDAERVEGAPRDFDGLAAFLADYPHEGIVWHHPDGRMAKIKRRDFPR